MGDAFLRAAIIFHEIPAFAGMTVRGGFERRDEYREREGIA